MKTMMNEAIMELELNELKDMCGGDSYEAFLVYADYLNTLFDKYNCHGIREVKKFCTHEELARIKELAVTTPNPDAWRSTPYHPSRPNYKDRIVSLAEEIGSELEWMLRDLHLIRKPGRYMELHVDEVLPDAEDIQGFCREI